MLFYIAALVGSILLFNVCSALKTNNIVITFSKGTLLILGLHTPIIEIYDKCCDILHLPNLPLVSSIVVMILCYYPIKMILKHCPVLLGK